MARSGTEHVTTAPAVLQPLAGSAVASAGRVVATLTPVAVSGPALRTLRRYSAASPSTTGSGASASVTDRSAFGGSAEASHPYARGSRSSTVAVSLPLPQSMSASRRPSRARTASLPAPARKASQPAPPSSMSSPPRPASASSASLPTSWSAPAPPLTPCDARDVVTLAGRAVVGAAAERHLDRPAARRVGDRVVAGAAAHRVGAVGRRLGDEQVLAGVAGEVVVAEAAAERVRPGAA